MIVRIHIERLVVDGPPMAPRDRRALVGALEQHLAGLVAGDGGLAGPRSDARILAPPLTEAAWSSPAALGEAAARSIHGGLAQ